MSGRKTFNYPPGTGGNPSPPPMLFQDVNMAVFPLRADILALRRFCDDYLNVVPPEIGFFQPTGPFVLLGIINYGSMSSEVLNTGWVAQNEVAFSIPLDWHRREGDRLVFHDRGTISPFIYVDSDTSQVTGRETFGWPKEHVWMSHEESSTRWGPQQIQRLVTLRSRPPESGAAEWRHGGRRFLEIGRERPAGPTLFPPSPASLLNPWQAWSRMTESWLQLAGEGFKALLRPPGSGYPPLDPQAAMQMAFASVSQMAAPNAAMASNVLNFKQFPRAEHPNPGGTPNAAYQALILSRMALAQFHRGGLLGETSLLLGDLSGGYRVRLSRQAAGSILDALGLVVAADDRWEDEDAAILKPIFPCWMDLDMRYEKSETVCWRRPDWGNRRTPPDLSWSDESGERIRKVPPKDNDRCAYNLSLRSATEEITGRLSFPDTTLRVFPLYAPKPTDGDEDDEDAFCASVLGDGRCYRRWGDFVYLVAESSEQVADRDTGAISRWAHRKLAFAVPVERRDPALEWGAKDSILEWGLVEPIVFVDSDLEAIRCREVNGVPAIRASLVSPPSVWMEQFQKKDARSSRLVLETELPAGRLGPGRRVERGKLLEIYRGKQPESGHAGIPFEDLQKAYDGLFKLLENPGASMLELMGPEVGKELLRQLIKKVKPLLAKVKPLLEELKKLIEESERRPPKSPKLSIEELDPLIKKVQLLIGTYRPLIEDESKPLMEKTKPLLEEVKPLLEGVKHLIPKSIREFVEEALPHIQKSKPWIDRALWVVENPGQGFVELKKQGLPMLKASLLEALCRIFELFEDQIGEKSSKVSELATLVLGTDWALNLYSLKQFRDAELGFRACYQSRVRQRILLRPGSDSAPGQPARRQVAQFKEEGGDPLWLALHRYPALSVTRLLGLEPCWTDDSGDRVIDYFRPMRWSFWIKGTMDIERADEGEPTRRPASGQPATCPWEEVPANPDLEKGSWTPSLLEPNPLLVELLNGRHTVEEPLLLVKMWLDAQVPLSERTSGKWVEGGGDLGPRPSEEGEAGRKLTAMKVQLQESGRVELTFKTSDEAANPSFAGKWLSILGVSVLLLDKGPHKEKIKAFGIHIPGGATAAVGKHATAAVGKHFSLTFDPNEQ